MSAIVSSPVSSPLAVESASNWQELVYGVILGVAVMLVERWLRGSDQVKGRLADLNVKAKVDELAEAAIREKLGGFEKRLNQADGDVREVGRELAEHKLHAETRHGAMREWIVSQCASKEDVSQLGAKLDGLTSAVMEALSRQAAKGAQSAHQGGK